MILKRRVGRNLNRPQLLAALADVQENELYSDCSQIG